MKSFGFVEFFGPGFWLEVWPNKGRLEPYPPLDADAVNALGELALRLAATGGPRLKSQSAGGYGRDRRWIGFVPEAALGDVRRALGKHGIKLGRRR